MGLALLIEDVAPRLASDNTDSKDIVDADSDSGGEGEFDRDKSEAGDEERMFMGDVDWK